MVDIKNSKEISEIDEAYKLNECMNYIECGSFEKDLDRVLALISKSSEGVVTDDENEHPQIKRLIDKTLFFACLTSEEIINMSDLLSSKCNSISSLTITCGKGKSRTTYHFYDFDVKVEEGKIYIY